MNNYSSATGRRSTGRIFRRLPQSGSRLGGGERQRAGRPAPRRPSRTPGSRSRPRGRTPLDCRKRTSGLGHHDRADGTASDRRGRVRGWADELLHRYGAGPDGNQRRLVALQRRSCPDHGPLGRANSSSPTALAPSRRFAVTRSSTTRSQSSIAIIGKTWRSEPSTKGEAAV
jgi:hypothetical protein